ncbi:hypothetical protein WJX75_002699 [Coccomyxa subellipsoidea]|uniref:CP12 domain-containing protein n=1 Tax=Coccomyxa subellipsoidea TaxID=248742 RepID=A0ABR2YSV4_9CHLO
MQSSSLAKARVGAPRAPAVHSRPVAMRPRAGCWAVRAQPKEAVETDDKEKDAAAEGEHPKELEEIVYTDPLELYCDDNPEADECRVYED